MKGIYSYFTYTLLVIFACVACTPSGDKEQTKAEEMPEENMKEEREEAIKERGIEVSGQVFEALSTELRSQIESGTIADALAYCSEHAIHITDSLADVHNAEIRRVTDKYRNPANRATEAETEILNEYRKAIAADKELEPKIELQDNQYVYHAPIVMNQPLCLNCHGDVEKDIGEEDYITINLLYPDDKATGFSMGELRGMWQIKFAAPEL